MANRVDRGLHCLLIDSGFVPIFTAIMVLCYKAYNGRKEGSLYRISTCQIYVLSLVKVCQDHSGCYNFKAIGLHLVRMPHYESFFYIYLWLFITEPPRISGAFS